MGEQPNRKGSIPLLHQKILWAKAAGRCAFRDPRTGKPCRQELVHFEDSSEADTVIGENAHIEGEKPTAARYRASMTDAERNCYVNLVLLCRNHHKIVDDEERTYTIERLKEDKRSHEDWVRTTLRPQEKRGTPRSLYVTEEIHSTILAVQQVPRFIYAAPCSLRTERPLKEEAHGHALPPLILRDQKLYSFADLKKQPEHLRKFLKLNELETHDTIHWEEDSDKRRSLVELLKRCLNKIAGRRGLLLDKENDRYYFAPLSIGSTRKVKYRAAGGKLAERKVVWRPTIKATGKPRRDWVHRALRLRFQRAAAGKWFVSLRPEFHFTKDGQTPIDSPRVGPRTTKKKSRMFNYDVLKEVHFWRMFISDSAPRIILEVGGQSLVISSVLERAKITWPGVKDDAKTFRAADIEEDLFSVAGLDAVLKEEGELDLMRRVDKEETSEQQD